MAAHIEARAGDYAPTVLLPGDPDRAAWIADTFLSGARCINRRRGMLGFTGFYRGKPVSIQSTGIGASSFLIYANELIDHFGAGTLVRVGTCGGLSAKVSVRSLVISSAVKGEDKCSGQVFGLYRPDAGPDPELLRGALTAAPLLGITCSVGLTGCSDLYYHPLGRARFAGLIAAGALSVDMETSALYRLADHRAVRALSICTVVDHITRGEDTDYSERQGLFGDMAHLALEVAA